MTDPPTKKAPAKRRKPTHPTPKPKVTKPAQGGPKIAVDEVELLGRPGHKDKGDGPDGEYWDVLVGGDRAGEVFVNVIDEPPIGKHASLQIFLNQNRQGKGIGRVAYRKAAEASRHDVLHLHMRKSNLASRLAAEAAGFEDVSPPGITQLILKRERRCE
jgi:hypothetical protein